MKTNETHDWVITIQNDTDKVESRIVKNSSEDNAEEIAEKLTLEHATSAHSGVRFTWTLHKMC